MQRPRMNSTAPGDRAPAQRADYISHHPAHRRRGARKGTRPAPARPRERRRVEARADRPWSRVRLVRVRGLACVIGHQRRAPTTQAVATGGRGRCALAAGRAVRSRHSQPRADRRRVRRNTVGLRWGRARVGWRDRVAGEGPGNAHRAARGGRTRRAEEGRQVGGRSRVGISEGFSAGVWVPDAARLAGRGNGQRRLERLARVTPATVSYGYGPGNLQYFASIARR